MKTILSYLDNMFMNLPHTKEVERAKQEIAAMMEDKYNELIAEGKKENEAVGIVISEFGDLKELAVELGIEDLVHEDNTAKKIVTKEEAEDYIMQTKVEARIVGLGTVLCILSPVMLLLLSALSEYKHILSEQMAGAIGITCLFVMIASAVALFIMIGTKMEKYEYLKKETFTIDSSLEKYLSAKEEEIKFPSMVKIVIAVSLCILSVIPLLLGGILYEDNDFLHIMTLICLIVFVSIAVYIFITAGTTMDTYKVLLQKDDYSEKGKKTNKIIDKIAGPYWIAAVIIYLYWSFSSMAWNRTWIVWPIAGVLFAFIAVLCNSIQQNTKEVRYK